MSFVLSNIPEERLYNGKVFPLTYEWISQNSEGGKASVADWLVANRQSVDTDLLAHKAILFRCSGVISSHEDFHGFVEGLDYQTMPYVGGAAVRTQLTERVFTANESPSSETIPFHHELAQTPSPPTHLFFYCDVAPTSGGATPILVSGEVCERLQHLQPAFMRSLQSRGVQYVRVMPELDDPTSAIGRGWRSTFQCADREGAESALRALGSSWEWLPDGSLKTITATVPAVRTDDQPPGARRSGQQTFFNSVVAAFTGWNDSRNDGARAVRLGELTPVGDTAEEGGEEEEAGEEAGEGRYLDAAAIEQAARVMQEVCVAFPWRRGDVLLLDNRTVMHARRSFEGPRRILASLARDPAR